MSDDGFDDDFDDGFGFYDDLDYQDDDDLSALVDSMAETAFAQGDPVWDEFDAEYDTTEYHSDWSYYSDGGFFSDEEKAPGEGATGDSKHGSTVKGAGVEAGRVASGAKTNTAGRPLRKRRKLIIVDESGRRVPESAPIPAPAPVKATATVIVPTPPTPPKKIPTSSSNEAKKKNGVQPSKQEDVKISTSDDGLRAAMKRKPSTDEAVSP